ncbi:hypothetical protein B0H10DRAFT_2219369 [Mycena sp. CBHHK59/15]|nr:hypothetical protein B0H10DRAFT_2219369 [Mycena sp. CBHHK59/15]
MTRRYIVSQVELDLFLKAIGAGRTCSSAINLSTETHPDSWNSSADDGSSVRLGRSDDNEPTFQTGPSSNAHKSMVRDENLTHCEFGLGWHRYIKEIERASCLDTHSLHEQEHGSQIIRIYTDRYRLEWFNTLGTANSFNLAIINEGLLTKISNEYFMKLLSKTIAS